MKILSRTFKTKC